MTVSSPSIHLRAARIDFDGVALFRDLDLDLPAGQWTCLLGPSGAGKTTLLRVLAGLAEGAQGTRIEAGDGAPVTDRIAYMGQRDLLMPWLSVAANVAVGARLRGTHGAEARRRAVALLDQVGLADRADDRPDALSGGQRQRVALARTLFEDRPVVLMDEPFSALDAITRTRIQELAARLLAGRTVLLVTHDPMEALRLGHRVLVLRGSPAALAPVPVPEALPPRDPDDPSLLEAQGHLLAEIAAKGTEG